MASPLSLKAIWLNQPFDFSIFSILIEPVILSKSSTTSALLFSWVFDHIFTDAELYKKYELTDKEINIIESVIKERK